MTQNESHAQILRELIIDKHSELRIKIAAGKLSTIEEVALGVEVGGLQEDLYEIEEAIENEKLAMKVFTSVETSLE